MKITHLVVGQDAANSLQNTIESSENEQIIILNDTLSVGPLVDENVPFTALRKQFRQFINPEQELFEEADELILKRTIAAIQADETQQLWLWMAGNADDITTYYWIVSQCQDIVGQLFVVNIAGLPFLNEEGRLFFAENVGQLPAKEFIKARRLSKCLTIAEWEVEHEEWAKLCKNNSGIRLTDGSKKLKSYKIDYYDAKIIEILTNNFQKQQRVMNHLKTKAKLPVSEAFLLFRMQLLMQRGKIVIAKEGVKLAA